MAVRDLPIGRLLAALCVFLLAASQSAAAQTQDTTPSGMVAFFTAPDPTTGACPAGWFVPPQAQGRLLVGVIDATSVGGGSPNAPMTNATDPTHVHGYSASVNLPKEGQNGGSCCNQLIARSGTYTTAGTTSPATSNLPFIQLIVCQKQ